MNQIKDIDIMVEKTGMIGLEVILTLKIIKPQKNSFVIGS